MSLESKMMPRNIFHKGIGVPLMKSYDLGVVSVIYRNVCRLCCKKKII